MHKTKTFKFKSFNGYEHNPTLTREAALMIGVDLIAWSQSPEEEEPPAEPRLWVGKSAEVKVWWWYPSNKEWSMSKISLSQDDVTIFVPPTDSKPVGDPTKLDSLPLCREVDWEVE